MIIPKNSEEIELMRESALVVSKTLGMIAKEVFRLYRRKTHRVRGRINELYITY